jgi:hypothetical protein
MPPKDLMIHQQGLPKIRDWTGIPIREDVLYTNHKADEKSAIRKRADKTLEILQEPLKKLLEAEEAVLYIAQAQAPISAIQQLTLGWMTYYVTQTMLVVTNRRLLAFHKKSKGLGRWVWGRRVRSIRFGDLAEAKVKGFLSHYLQLTYADGRKEKYWGIRGADAKKLRLILEAAMPMRAAEATPARGSVALCPSCFAALEKGQEQCRQCGQLFATTSEMWKRTILFPGGGYFYTGQTGLGILDAIAESLLIGWLAFFLLIAAGFPEPVGDLEPYLGQGAAAFAAVFVAGILVMEKLVTGLHARHFVQDFYPLTKAPSQGKWLGWGLAAYLGIALAVSALIPWDEKPVVQVAPDLNVYRADFGIFSFGLRGEDRFTSTSALPMSPGTRYGVVLRFRTPRPTVHFKVEFEVDGEVVTFRDADGNPAPQEETVETDGGLIARFWQIGPQEPGDQTLKIYLDGTLVRSFQFTVR